MSNKPTPHPHAELIKAWADGAKIQKFNFRDKKWEDSDTPTWLGDKYRVKPEEPSNEPWKPKWGETYYFIDDKCDILRGVCLDGIVENKRYENGNCFRTNAEAKAAIHRVKAALKAENVNAPTNVSGNVGSTELDGKPLSDGEKELIKALRKYPLTQVHGLDDKSVLIHFDDNGHIQAKKSHIAVWSDTSKPATDKALKDAIVKIKAEQEAGNEAE